MTREKRILSEPLIEQRSYGILSFTKPGLFRKLNPFIGSPYQNFNRNFRESGFTLIELLIVITIIGILSGIMFTLVNYSKHIKDSRNTVRRIDVDSISKSIYEYLIDNGQLPLQVTETPTEICRTGSNDCSGLVDLSDLTINSKYMIKTPVDPTLKNENTNNSGYAIASNGNGRFTVSAPYAENETLIEITR